MKKCLCLYHSKKLIPNTIIKENQKLILQKKKWWKQFKYLSNEKVVFHFVLLQKKFSTQLDYVLNVDEKLASYSQNSGLLNIDLEYHNLPLFNFFQFPS